MKMQDLYERLFLTNKENLDCIKNEDGTIRQIVWCYDNLLYSITEVEEIDGEEKLDNYLLRINPKKTFDRWSNADIEATYDTLNDLCFDIFESSLTWIYRWLAQKYIEQYVDLCK